MRRTPCPKLSLGGYPCRLHRNHPGPCPGKQPKKSEVEALRIKLRYCGGVFA